MSRRSSGKQFRAALVAEQPLQVLGVLNAYSALMARDLGYRALYLSGAGVANASYGLPDLGLTTLDNVLEDATRITAAVDLPLLVDIDTGWGGALMIERAIKAMVRAGVAAVHLEDQVQQKRCGHRPGKVLVATDEMSDRIKAAVDARTDPDFVVMARTDAFASEGMEGMLARCRAYCDAGADMLFLEAVTTLEHYTAIRKELTVPVLANITEFGKTPLFTVDELKAAGVDMALYPLSAARAMYKAAWEVMHELRRAGSQQACLGAMQTRDELYRILNYDSYEKQLDRLFSKNSGGVDG